MLQDLFVPCHQGIAKAGNAGLVNDRIRLSIVLMGLGDSVLCLGMWPSSTQSAQALAGAALSLHLTRVSCPCLAVGQGISSKACYNLGPQSMHVFSVRLISNIHIVMPQVKSDALTAHHHQAILDVHA